MTTDEIRTAAFEAAGAILPIEVVAEGSGRRRHVGSCFVLDVDDMTYIVTAAHVLEGPGTHYIAAPVGQLVVPAVRDTLTEEEDVTFWEVARDQLETIGVANRLNGAEYAIPFAQPGATCFVMGHPVSRSRRTEAQTVLRTKCVTITGELRERLPTDPANLNERHLLGQYDPSQAVNPAGESINAGQIVGVSGGPMLMALSLPALGGMHLLAPIGVVIEFHSDNSIIASTRIDTVLERIGPPSQLG